MKKKHDTRSRRSRLENLGVSPVIGFILIIGVIFSALTLIQFAAVPVWNQEVEFQHSNRVQQDMAKFQSDVFLTSATGKTTSTNVELGTDYPSRPFLVNPPSSTGTISTGGPREVTLRNVVAMNPEADDYWNGTPRNFTTRNLTYSPKYYEYSAPDTVYENSAVFNREDGSSVVFSGSGMVHGRVITLINLNGSLSTTSRTGVNVESVPTSAPYTSLSVTNQPGDEVTLEIPSSVSQEVWGRMLEDQMVSNGGYVESYGVTDGVLEIRLVSQKDGKPVVYELRMAKIGVGTGITDEGAHYLTTSPDENPTTLPEGESETLTVQVRDRYNNPVSGARVNFSLEGNGTLSTNSTFSDADGEATVVYDAPLVDGGDNTVVVNASISQDPSAGFDPGAKENVQINLTVVNTDNSGVVSGGINPNYLGGVVLRDASITGSDDVVFELENTDTNNDRRMKEVKLSFYGVTQFTQPPGNQGGNGTPTRAVPSTAVLDGTTTLQIRGSFVSYPVTINPGATETFSMEFYTSGGSKFNVQEGDFFVFEVIFDKGQATYFIAPAK